MAVLTCLAAFRALGGISHHCTLELPHVDHECSCGIRWPSTAHRPPTEQGKKKPRPE